MPAANRPRPGDTTGVEAAKLKEANKEALEARAAEMSTINETEAALKDEIIDLSDGPQVAPEPEPEVSFDDEVTVDAPTKVFRAADDVEEMTFGAQNPPWNFKRGQQYRVPKDLYDHLDRKGFVWH